jgi:hypothetical protein
MVGLSSHVRWAAHGAREAVAERKWLRIRSALSQKRPEATVARRALAQLGLGRATEGVPVDRRSPVGKAGGAAALPAPAERAGRGAAGGPRVPQPTTHLESLARDLCTGGASVSACVVSTSAAGVSSPPVRPRVSA